MVVDEPVRVLLVPKLLERVRPEHVAHEPVRWRLAEAIDLRRPRSALHPGTQHALGRRTERRSSSVLSSGLSPPWMQRNCLFMTAASGRVQNDSMHAS